MSEKKTIILKISKALSKTKTKMRHAKGVANVMEIKQLYFM